MTIYTNPKHPLLEFPKRIALLFALFALFVCTSITSLRAQVASPHNFPHSYGAMYSGDYGPQIQRTYQAMGMNGHVVYSPLVNTNFVHMVLNKGLDQYMSWAAWIYGPNVIQKNSHIWISSAYDNRVCTVDTMGVVLNQIAIANSNLVQMVADTNDHVYLIYKATGTTGFGVVRYGSTFVPDWHKFYPGDDATEAFWGIDQRLYVTCMGRVTVLDANGNRLKDLFNVGSNYTVYQDHGLGIVSMVADTVKVIRTDSSMALRWAKKFKPVASYFGQPFTLIGVAGTATPGSNDLVVTTTTRINQQTTQNCNYPYTEEIFNVLVDNNGVVQGNKAFTYLNQSYLNKFQSTVTSTPFGDAMFAFDVHSCLLAAHIEDRYLGIVPGYDLRQSCSGVAPSVSSQNYTPTLLPYVGALGTTTGPSLAITPDNTAFAVNRYGLINNTGSVTCIKPCLSVTQTPMGGGQVAYNDNTYGFYTIHYDFGDGTTATTNDPVHTYPPYGTWPVTVIATNGCGADTSITMVHACATAQVSGPANSCVGATATYTETSGLNSTGLSWLVNGVSMGTGSSFAWTPTAAGTYALSTVYYDAPCRDTTTRSVIVSAGLPVAGFTYAVTAPGQLTFTNTSTAAQSYDWTFGDGTTSTATNPVHTYFSPWVNGGNFTICLTATNACGSNTYCYNFTCPIPYANFSIPSTSGLTANISDQAVNGTITWDFGDGTTGTGTTNSHTYALPGTYNICQTVTNACASHSSCRTVIVDNSSSAAFRTILSATNYDNNVNAIAAQPNGDVMVALGGSSANAGLLPMDSTGFIRGPLNTWTGGATQIMDLHAMGNGHFAFFGQSFNSGSNFDPYWGELDKMGNIVQAKYLPISNIAQLGTRAFKLPSGYFYVVNESSGPLNYYYIKLDQNLQVQYVRYNTSKIYGGLEAPDGTIWLVQQPNNGSTILEFVHLNALGVGTEKYSTTLPFGGNNAFFYNTMGLGMDCDGNMYGMMTISDIYPSTGATPRLGLFRFNTVTHAVDTRMYRVGMTASANNPVHNPIIRTMVKYPNGHWIGYGTLVRTPAQVGIPPDAEKFVMDLDPSTFTVAVSAYGTPNVTVKEEVMDAYVAGPGKCYTLSKLLFAAKPVEIHRHSSPSNCQLPASVLAPEAVVEFSNTNVTYSGAAVSSTAFTTPAANWTRVSAPLTGSSLLQCSGACPSGLTASFTYTVSGNTVTLTSTSTPGAMLSWSLGGQNCVAVGSNGNTTMTVTLPCGTTAITLTASDQCGTASTTQTITLSSAAPVSIGPNQTVCPGASATFTATSGFVSYLWSNGATTSSITVSIPGTYGVTATDANGCTAIASATLSNFPAPTVSAGPNQTVCAGNSATFTATPGFASYLWSNGATTGSITVTNPGNYSVTATDANGCTTTASATLSIFSGSPISVGPNQTVCPGASATFTATSGFVSYLWSNGATTGSITVSTPGTYTVSATDANGCIATTFATLSNFSTPSVSIGANQSVCVGASATFTATSGFASYLWSNGATTGSITVSTPGTYDVTATAANGCTTTATATLSNFSTPTVSIGPNQSVCPGASATFTATSGFASYSWSNGATTGSITLSTPGTYGVTATDANGCTATASATLGVFTPTSFSLGNDTSFCADTTWALTGPGGASAYAWCTGATTQGIAADTSGSYWLLATDANGCTSADTIQLQLSTECVWPGDADHDGVANNVDLLAIAYGMAATGTTRANATTAWYGQPSTNWSSSLPLGANFKHLDSDGNGTVQLADTMAIQLNFGLTHNKVGGVTTGVPVWIVPELDSFPAGDTVFFNVHWGDASLPVASGLGLAFTVQIDPAHLMPGTLRRIFPTSFLGNGVPDLATMTIPFPSTGDDYFAISRQDRLGRSGHGAVMRMGFLPDQVLPLTATLGYVPVQLSGIVAVNGDFLPIACAGLNDSILIYNPVNAVTASNAMLGCALYPVPASDVAYLDLRMGQDADVTVVLTDLHGRKLTMVQAATLLPVGRHRISIPTDQLSEGVYFVRLTVDETVKVLKMVVAR